MSPEFDHSLLVNAAPTRVLEAFFDPEALKAWWQVARSVTIPRPLGVFAVEWPAADHADEILGPLGGAFYGVVMEHVAGREFFVADAFWLPPQGEPIGPMALTVSCQMDGPACRLRVKQTGFDDGERWSRYYAVIAPGWRSSLAALKDYVERA